MKKEGNFFWQIYKEKELHFKYCIFYLVIDLHADPDAKSVFQSIQVKCNSFVCEILMSCCHSIKSMECSSTRPWWSYEACLLFPCDKLFNDTIFFEIWKIACQNPWILLPMEQAQWNLTNVSWVKRSSWCLVPIVFICLAGNPSFLHYTIASFQ